MGGEVFIRITVATKKIIYFWFVTFLLFLVNTYPTDEDKEGVNLVIVDNRDNRYTVYHKGYFVRY